jgi:hypothetical protein
MFENRAHYLSAKATGSLARPSNLATQARIKACPIRAAREKLRKAATSAKAGLTGARAKLAELEAESAGPHGWVHFTASDIARCKQRVEFHTARVTATSTDLALFDAMPR